MMNHQFQELRAEACETNNLLRLILEHLRMQAEPTISPEAFKEPTPVLKNSLQEKIAQLKEIVSGGLEDGIFGKIIAVLDELAIARFNPFVTPSPLPPMPSYPPTVPMITPPNPWPPYLPYVGDPPGGFGGTTVCFKPGEVQSTLTSKCSTESPHAAHTFGGRPTQLCEGTVNASSPDATGTSELPDETPF